MDAADRGRAATVDWMDSQPRRKERVNRMDATDPRSIWIQWNDDEDAK